MKLKSVKISQFRRFADLQILDLPVEAKLIVLLGPNGCGKSALFDAFQKKLKVDIFHGMNDELNRYYLRSSTTENSDNSKVVLKFHDEYPDTNDKQKKSLYVRSAYRHQPSFNNTSISQPENVLDRNSIWKLNDIDQTVGNNFSRIFFQLVGKVTRPGLKTDEIIKETIGDLQTSMTAVFEDLNLDSLVSDFEIGTFTFEKGKVERFLYENLSAGEKAAFDLLLDIVVNRKAFDDTIYCIDEPEIHLNTRIQRNLLKELYKLIPEKSQLWLATHSIGMVRAAQEIYADDSTAVVFLDLGFNPDGNQRDYAREQIIKPEIPNRNFWSRHYSVALDDLADLLVPKRIVFCEGTSQGNKPSLDESCYNRIFAQEFPETIFISVGSKTTVEKRMKDLLPILDKMVSSTEIIRFRDRDDLNAKEMQEMSNDGVRALSKYRNMESMLVSDDVLNLLCISLNKPELFETLKNVRKNKQKAANGNHADDDYKSAVQAVFLEAKNFLQPYQKSEKTEWFMREVLAPLITKDTQVYSNLKADIFGGEP